MACSLRTMRSVHSLSLAVLGGLGLLLSGPSAKASSGLGVIGNPGQVAVAPAAAGSRVQLTGLYAVGAGGTDPCYSPPQCGTLYYACPAGEEAKCQMEWGEMKAAATAGNCVGFGATRSSTGGAPNNGRLRMAGEALGEPDVYPLGMGVHVGPCTGQEFACSAGLEVSATRAKQCTGASDAAVGDTAPGGTGGAAPGGSGGAPGGSGGAAAVADADGKGETGGKSGCSVAASSSMVSGGLLLIGLWLTCAGVRRRRERPGRRA